MAQLPSPGNSSLPPEYAQFVADWGTHFVSSQSFGGYCEFEVVVNASVRAGMEVDLLIRASMSLLQLYLESKGLKQKMSIFFQDLVKLSAEFKNGSMVIAKCGGGYPGNIDAGQWDEWVRSIPYQPAPIPASFRLQPVSQLVDDIGKRAAVQQAVADYIQTHAKNATEHAQAGLATGASAASVGALGLGAGSHAEFTEVWSLQ